MKRVVFLDACTQEMEDLFSEEGFVVDRAYEWDREKSKKACARATGIIVRSRFPIDREFLASCSEIEFIGRFGAGLENIDLQAASEFNIKCYNVPEGNRRAVAEHALGMTLYLINHMGRSDSEIRGGIWKRAENTGRELHSLTVGIIGFGYMGKEFSELLLALGANVIAHDKYAPSTDPRVETVSKEDLRKRSDVISLHLPLSSETKYYLSQEYIELSDKPFFLINTSRGPVVDTQAVVNALDSGLILGAGLDVLEYEKASFTEAFTGDTPAALERLLQKTDNTLLTSHIAGWTQESFQKMGKFLVEKILTDK